MKLWPSSRAGRAARAFAVVAAIAVLYGIKWRYEDRSVGLPETGWIAIAIFSLALAAVCAVYEFRNKPD